MALRGTVLGLSVYYILMLWQSCTEINKKKVGRRSQQATGSNRKRNEVLGSVRTLQDASGSSRKPQEALERHNIELIINK